MKPFTFNWLKALLWPASSRPFLAPGTGMVWSSEIIPYVVAYDMPDGVAFCTVHATTRCLQTRNGKKRWWQVPKIQGLATVECEN